MNEDFSNNLRLLCSYYKSIAEVCRKLDINRAQFNRYLSGKHKPSANLFKKICDFFGVEEFEMLLPHEHFKRILGVQKRTSKVVSQDLDDESPEAIAFRKLNSIGKRELEKYLGYYFEYQMSMATPGKILRNLVCFKEINDKIYSQRIERVKEKGKKKASYDLYKGSVFFLADRIFLLDYASLTDCEISQTILYPTFKQKVTTLTGLKLGVSTSGERVPACLRILYEYLGTSIELKKAIKLCGLIDLAEFKDEKHILNAITNDIKDDEWRFKALF